MTTTEQALQGARRLARSAAIARAGVEACPYPADGSATDRAARLAWMTSYRSLRPFDGPPVSYSGGLTELAHGPDSPDDGAPATIGLNLYPEAS